MRVLVATDLSDPSLPAVAAGAEEARRRKAGFEVVHAVGLLDLEASYVLELGSPTLHVRRPDREGPGRALGEAVARLGAGATCKILDDPPAAAILREAEAIGAELIVVGREARPRSVNHGLDQAVSGLSRPQESLSLIHISEPTRPY